MQNNSMNPNTSTQKLPYSAPMLVDYGSVRELTQDFSVLGAVSSVVAAII